MVFVEFDNEHTNKHFRKNVDRTVQYFPSTGNFQQRNVNTLEQSNISTSYFEFWISLDMDTEQQRAILI